MYGKPEFFLDVADAGAVSLALIKNEVVGADKSAGFSGRVSRRFWLIGWYAY